LRSSISGLLAVVLVALGRLEFKPYLFAAHGDGLLDVVGDDVLLQARSAAFVASHAGGELLFGASHRVGLGAGPLAVLVFAAAAFVDYIVLRTASRRRQVTVIV
jgi:hypothetical protein